MVPGHRATIGTRKPPSKVVPFSPRKGVLPPSGQEKVSAPLSLVKTTMVLSAMPRSSSFLSMEPTSASNSIVASAYRPYPLLFCHLGERWVHTWLRVELCQRKNGLLAFVERSMKSTDRRTSSSSMSSILNLALGSMFGCGGSGPASTITCLPTLPQRGSVVGSSTLVALLSTMLRGPNL